MSNFVKINSKTIINVDWITHIIIDKPRNGFVTVYLNNHASYGREIELSWLEWIELEKRLFPIEVECVDL